MSPFCGWRPPDHTKHVRAQTFVRAPLLRVTLYKSARRARPAQFAASQRNQLTTLARRIEALLHVLRTAMPLVSKLAGRLVRDLGVIAGVLSGRPGGANSGTSSSISGCTRDSISRTGADGTVPRTHVELQYALHA